MIRIYSLSDPNRKRTKAPPLNRHMILRSRGIRGHVYEMRNHKLNSPKTRRFAFTNIVSVTKDFETPRSIIRRPFLILKTLFLVGLSWHIYRVCIQRRWYFCEAGRLKNLNDITLILCNPKQLQLRRLKWWNTSPILNHSGVIVLHIILIELYQVCSVIKCDHVRSTSQSAVPLAVLTWGIHSLHRPYKLISKQRHVRGQ